VAGVQLSVIKVDERPYSQSERVVDVQSNIILPETTRG